MQTVIGNQLATAIDHLQQQQLVAIPTETVYGLAANALNEAAVIQIFEAKKRPRFNPLIVHVPTIQSISTYAHLQPLAEKLAHAFMPGPFTLLLHKTNVVPSLVTAGSNKVAIRIPQHPLTLELLQQLPFPLAAPSANVFGYVSPTTAQHVYKGMQGIIPYILDGGACTVGVESTIVEVTNEHTVIVHRVGGIAVEAIAAVAGVPVILASEQQEATAPNTPGQLKSHYATTTPLMVGNVASLIAQYPNQNIAVLGFNTLYPQLPEQNQYLLSPEGSLNQAAQRLFDTMRLLDTAGYDLIIAENFPNEGLGRAINDRLHRAQVQYK